MHRCSQVRELMLQHIIRGAALERLDCGFLSQRTCYENERHIRRGLFRQHQRAEPVKRGQSVVGQD